MPLNKFQLVHGGKSFNWIPDKADDGDEKQWEENYAALISKIRSEWSIESNHIQLQKKEHAIDINDGEELMEAWHHLVQDKDNTVCEIKVSSTKVNFREYPLFSNCLL